MQKISLVCLSILLVFLIFTSCEKQENGESTDKRVMATFQSLDSPTRAIATEWENGDLIGIFCVAPGEKLGINNFASNKCYQYHAASKEFRPFSSEDEIYFGRNCDFTFFAYYPYRSDVSDPTSFTHTVGNSQLSAVDFRKADLITGKSSVVNSNGTVMMDFYHIMAMVQLDWNANTTHTSVKTLSALFRNKATVNLSAAVESQVTTIGEPTEITMYRNSGNDNKAQYAVRLPGTIISPNQEILVPKGVSGEKLSDPLRYSGREAMPLSPGKKYDLSGTVFEITASTANGTFATGYGGGMFFKGRKCILKVDGSNISKPNSKFVGFYEVGNDGGLTRIIDESITVSPVNQPTHAEYQFTVTGNRNIKAVFTDEFSDWVADEVKPVPDEGITVEKQEGGFVSADGIMKADGKDITIKPEGGTFKLTASAIREIRLNGVVIDHERMPNLTIRNNATVGGFNWTAPAFSANPNSDLNMDGTIKGERKTTMAIIGPDGKDITSKNGGLVKVKQLAGTWINKWSIHYTLSDNPIAATGGTATIKCYAVNERSLAGIVDKKYNVYVAPDVSIDNNVFLKSSIIEDGTNKWKLTVSASNNTTTSVRSASVTLQYQTAKETVGVTQTAGKITSNVYGPWLTKSVSASVSPVTVAANGGNFVYSAIAKQVRDVTPVWNGVVGSGTAISGGDSRETNVSAVWTKVDGVATINSNGTGSYSNNESTSRLISNAYATYDGVNSVRIPVYQEAGAKVYSKPVITMTANKGIDKTRPLTSAAGDRSILTYSVSVRCSWNGIGADNLETYYPTITGSAEGFVRIETEAGKSRVSTEANNGKERSVVYTANFTIGGQTAEPVTVTIWQARAWNVDIP